MRAPRNTWAYNMEQKNPTSMNPELQKFLDEFNSLTIKVNRICLTYPSANLEWRTKELLTFKSIEVYPEELDIISKPILRDLIILANDVYQTMDVILYVGMKSVHVETKSGRYVKMMVPCVTIQCSQK